MVGSWGVDRWDVQTGGGCTVEMSCLLGGEVRQEDQMAGTKFLYGVSHFLLSWWRPEGGGAGIKRQWKSRACCASVRRRRWESAAGSRAAPGPKEERKHTSLEQLSPNNLGDVNRNKT